MHDIKCIRENSYQYLPCAHTYITIHTYDHRLYSTVLYNLWYDTHTHTHTYMHAYTNVEHPPPYRANFKVTPNIPTKIEK